MNYKPLIRKLTGTQSVLVTNRLFIEYTGSHVGGIFLQQLIYHQSHAGEGVYYPKTYEEWTAEIIANRKTLMTHKANFEAAGFLQTKVKKQDGTPTLHWCLDEDMLYELLLNYVNKSGKTPVPKVQKGTMENTKIGTIESGKIGTFLHYNTIDKEERENKTTPTKKVKTEKANYEWQAHHNTTAGHAMIATFAAKAAAEAVQRLHPQLTGKAIAFDQALQWCNTSAIGKPVVMEKCWFTPTGEIYQTDLTNHIINSAKVAMTKGALVMPKAAAVTPAKKEKSIFD